MILADFGAEVIKVEQPKLGDDTRWWSPPSAGELSAYFMSVNRNKRSLTLNLKHPEAQQIARDLALKSDVLVENFKAGAMQRYGLDYDTLAADNPGLVYCSITGYGQDSPYAYRPGYDFAIQAQSGLMAITGEPEGDPMKVGVAVSDVFTGFFALNAIQTALLYRQQSGRGQYIDVCLLDSQIAALVNIASNYLVSGELPLRLGNAHPNIVPYQAFQASDQMFILAVGNDNQFREACKVMGVPRLSDDPMFASNPQRVRNREALIPLLKPIFLERSGAEWVEAFLGAGVPAAEINNMAEALRTPHAQARHLVREVTLEDGTVTEMLAPIQKMSLTPPDIHFPPPALGQDSTTILQEVLGLDEAVIQQYSQAGII
jgi:crotonobetainyl-CoA:carnitine CoA-transferase CaiB-like acyl-CoA transferase